MWPDVVFRSHSRGLSRKAATFSGKLAQKSPRLLSSALVENVVPSKMKQVEIRRAEAAEMRQVFLLDGKTQEKQKSVDVLYNRRPAHFLSRAVRWRGLFVTSKSLFMSGSFGYGDCESLLELLVMA
jgi:hypothetical protein